MTKERPACHDSYCYCWITPFIHWRWHNGWQSKTWCRMTAQVTNRRIKKETGLHLFMTVPVVCSIFLFCRVTHFTSTPLSYCSLCVFIYMHYCILVFRHNLQLRQFRAPRTAKWNWGGSAERGMKNTAENLGDLVMLQRHTPLSPATTTHTHTHIYMQTHIHKAAEKLMNLSTYLGGQKSYLLGQIYSRDNTKLLAQSRPCSWDL